MAGDLRHGCGCSQGLRLRRLQDEGPQSHSELPVGRRKTSAGGERRPEEEETGRVRYSQSLDYE
ncbi:UNVERIFIED_CONTAM: hypothetical protein Sradi_1944200 [Sesamum radiatum]|uniref:Uncharacterized protein n=1 Tax=Sesamum radiatum TaxID=300843 RepID=A0AAW2TEF2_SESRA